MPFKAITCKLSVFILLSCFANANRKDEVLTTTNADSGTTSTTGTTSLPLNEVFLDDNEIHEWFSPNYPQAYPHGNDYLIIRADRGYLVSITVEKLDLEGDDGDFLLIKPGTTLKDDKKGKVFTYKLNSERKYLMDSNSAYIGFYVFGKNPNKKPGVLIKYQRMGEVISTTTEYATTAVTWPTPSASDSIYHTVYVSGKSQEEFNNSKVLNNFKTALADMATEYCETNNFLLAEEITMTNVQIYYLIECSYTWPDSDVCMKVRFALPVFLAENSAWTGYQLTTAHLEQMWNQLATKYLKEYNMDVYSIPDNDSSVIKWVVISLVVLFVFLIFLYFVKKVGHTFSPMKQLKRRYSDTSGIIQDESRVSKRSLAPHHLQVVPPFFDNDSNFQEFEPNVGIPARTYDHPLPLSEDDSDNDIIFHNFSNSRNNIPEDNRESLS